MKRPRIAVTMGDPLGIGPEIVVACLRDVPAELDVFCIGDEPALVRAAATIGADVEVRRMSSPEDVVSRAGVLNVLPCGLALPSLEVGRVDARAGRASFGYVEQAISLALYGAVQAVVTAPIHKEAWHAAGISYPGHTELLAARSGVSDFAMMLFNDDLRVVLVSIHVPLREAVEQVTVERELRTIRLADRAMRDFGIAVPRVAVAGLNPHAGEGGMFGTEDGSIIAPAVAQARAEGIDATGPWPGDTVFMNARKGQFDVVVAQYHDQGLIPLKYLGLDKGVNVTLGLPFVRTSVDHGTAFDIAGKGLADPSSLSTALQQAARIAKRR